MPQSAQKRLKLRLWPTRRGLLLGMRWFIVSALGLWFLTGMLWVRGWPLGIRGAALGVVAIVAILLWRRGVSVSSALLFASTAGLLGFFWLPPTGKGPWASGQAEHPVALREGTKTVLYGFREWAGEADRVRYGVRRVDPRTVESLTFGIEAFAAWEGAAHTWLTFGFRDGQRITVSVESRRAEGEPFSALRGLFKAYELIYVIGDERELIGRRVNEAEGAVYIYPVRASAPQLQQLFRGALARATQLARTPEYYNTLTNNCTTNLVGHVHEIAPAALPWFDLRIVFPGYADRLLYERRLLDTNLPFSEARTQFRVTR